MLPIPSSASSGACPGRIPRYPWLDGTVTWSTRPLNSCRSGVTITRWIFSGSAIARLRRLQAASATGCAARSCSGELLRLFQDFFDAARHKEGLLGDMIVFAPAD